MGGAFGRWWRAGLVGGALLVSLAGCDNSPWESGAAGENTIYSAMQEGSPRHMDSVASYWSNDTTFTYQIYEQPYGYHYLKRPFTLVGKSAEDVAKPRFLDKDGKDLPDDAPSDQDRRKRLRRPHQARHPVAAAPGVRQGRQRQLPLPPPEGRASWAAARRRSTFPVQGTRELVADDFVYALKRHATPRVIDADLRHLFRVRASG